MKSQKNLSKTLILSLIASLTAQMTLPNQALAQSRPLNVIRVQATSSLPSYRYDDYDIEKYESLSRDADRRLSDAQRNYESINRDYNQAVDRENRIKQNLQSKGRELESNRREESALERSIQQNQQAISQAEQAIPRLKTEVESLKSQVESTNRVIADLNARLASATTDDEKNQIKQQIESQTAVLNNLSSQLSSKNSQVSQVESQLQQARNELVSNGRKLEASRRENQSLESQISSLQRDQDVARREVQERERARNLATDEVQSRSREVEISRRNLDSTRRNVQLAGQVLEDQAIEQGAVDGQREGSELGTSRGSRDGEAAGTRDGRENGIRDGRQRDYDSGYASGKSKATSDALAKSQTDATANGTQDGLAQGKIDGLKNAYNIGLNEGLKHGAETGSDREAYTIGRKEGEAAGLAKAVEDARPQEGLGYKDKENEYLNAPLKKVIVGDQTLAQKFEGLQGRYSEEGDDRYYRPQPGNLPHPRLERFYLDAYDQSYRTELSNTYRSVYRRQYDSNYNSSYRRLYDENYRVRYSDSEKSGYDRGYSDTYQNQYDANYKVIYAAVYELNYDVNYEKFKLDVAERARGFKDGNRTASKAKGYDEGYRANYAANIELEKKKAYTAGQLRAKTLYDNNAVIVVNSLELKEVDADGINRPGEALAVVMKLKNFGLKAKIDLNSEVLESQGSLVVAQGKIAAGVVPPQSDATVVVPVQSSIAKTAIDGSSLQALVKATTGQTAYASQRLALNVQYPAKALISNFDGILIPGLATSVKIKVNNRSKSVQNLVINVAIDSTKVDSTQTQLVVSNLQPGTTQDLDLTLTGKMEARFEETPLELSTSQNQNQFAMLEKTNLTIIRKHSPTADSKGLIISSNLAVGAGKKLFGLEKLDTWDLRVDGSIAELAKISSYQTKIVHVLADLNSAIDAKTAETLKQLIAKNGTVVLWGSRLDRSPLAQAVLQNAGISVTQASQLNGQILGIERLKGMTANYAGEISILRVNSQKGTYALNSSSGVLGTITSGNGINERTGQTVVLGLDMMGLDNVAVQSILGKIEILKSSFDEKMKLAVASPSANMTLVVQDIIDEMISAELLGTGNFYKNNPEKNKIFRAGRKMIGESGRNSAQAKELTKAYPILMDVINKRLSKERWRAELVIEKRHGSGFNARSLKDLYCANISFDSLCVGHSNN